MYLYKSTTKGVFIVGHYDPGGRFVPESDYLERSAAAEHVHYLNGGVNPELFSQVIEHLHGVVANLNFLVEDLNQRLDREKK